MEPLSIFAVAVNVLQVVEVGVRVIITATQYRKSDNAFLVEHGDLRRIGESLNSMNNDLDTLLRQRTASAHLEPEEVHLVNANEECLRISKVFVECLDKMKLKDKHAMFDTVRKSLKALWQRDKIERTEKAVSLARNNLNVALLIFVISKQNKLLEQSSRAERRIIGMVESSSDQIQEDIRLLSEQMNGLGLDSAKIVMNQFATTHGDLLEKMSIWISSMQQQGSTSNVSKELSQRCESIISSLCFPQITERQDQIPEAYRLTYNWILEPNNGGAQPWDEFVSWLRESSSENRIYWIRGKIGAGKTVLLRFLAENLDVQSHMLPWAEGTTLLKATYFFWNAGNRLQKSIAGLLRTLLWQLLQQMPDLTPEIVPPKKWRMTGQGVKNVIDWTESELRACIKDCVRAGERHRKFLLLVDGLDEIEGPDESRSVLLDLLIQLASNHNVKICLSSRPCIIFNEALGSSPHLTLDELTHGDISSYITGQLYANRRFQRLSQHDKMSAEYLVEKLILKAAGVFLWVRLVVRHLLQGLRDGDGMLVLSEKVDQVPDDIDSLFTNLLQSIEPCNRAETSKLLQVALHIEEDYTTLHSSCLLDFSFIEHASPDFALSSSYNFSELDFLNESATGLRLESTLLKLNSRCLGLLHCGEEAEQFPLVQQFYLKDQLNAESQENDFLESDLLSKAGIDMNQATVLQAAGWAVGFAHGSFRDFLLRPQTQSTLYGFSQGPFDAKLYLLNARLAQLVALSKIDAHWDTIVGLASNVLLCIATAGIRETPYGNRAAVVVRPVLESLAVDERIDEISGWYVGCILRLWNKEKSSFLTIAIDFAIIAYVRYHLTSEIVRKKEGRPILDYILRPRFIGFSQIQVFVGNQTPNLDFIVMALQAGANPNEQYDGQTVWTLFLCLVADYFRYRESVVTIEEKNTYVEAIGLLLQHGADLLLSRELISGHANYEKYQPDFLVFEDRDDYTERRFPLAKPAIPGSEGQTPRYLASDLLQSLGTVYKLPVAEVRSIALRREAQELAWLFDELS